MRVLGLVALTAVVAGAQTPAPACTVPPSAGSVPGIIRATMRPLDHRALPLGYTAAVLEAIGEHYPTTAPVSFGSYLERADSIAVGAAFTALAFTTTDTGGVLQLTMLVSSLSPSFDHNVVTAVRAAAADHLPPMPRGTGRDVRFQLEVEEVVDESAARVMEDTAGSARMQWVATTIPMWSNALAAGLKPGAGQAPEYPEAGRQHAVGDSVVVQLVVGADGHVAPGTAMLRRAGYREFVQAVASHLAAMTFVPATIGACPVPALVTMPFTFAIKEY
jgi:TonB family protein